MVSSIASLFFLTEIFLFACSILVVSAMFLVFNYCNLLIIYCNMPWWRHQMETFSALLTFCAGNSPVTGEFPSQRPVTRIFDVFFNLRVNKRLSKQSWGCCFETQSRPLWRHSNASDPSHSASEELCTRSAPCCVLVIWCNDRFCPYHLALLHTSACSITNHVFTVMLRHACMCQLVVLSVWSHYLNNCCFIMQLCSSVISQDLDIFIRENTLAVTICKDAAILFQLPVVSTETQIASLWQNCYHWLHRNLSHFASSGAASDENLVE